MSLDSDWTEHADADSKHSLNTSTKSEGSSSLRVADFKTKSVHTLDVSENDSPSEARVEFSANNSANDGVAFPIIFFRFQDIDNYYALGYTYDNNDGYSCLRVEKLSDNGDVTKRAACVGNNFSNINMSDGNSLDRNGFIKWRVDCWVDSNGDLRFRLEEDADNDGVYTSIDNNSDAVFTGNDLNGGGAIGIGSPDGLPIGKTSHASHIDDMTIKY